MFYLVPLGLLTIFVFSLGAQSLRSFSRHKLEGFCRRRGAEKRLAVITKRYEQVGAAVNLARLLCLCLFLFGFFIESAITHPRNSSPDTFTVAVLVAVIVSLAGLADFWLPRAIVKLWGTPVVYFGWFLWSTTATLLYPFLVIDRLVTLFFCRLAGHTEDEDAFEEEIRTIVTEGHR